MTAKSRALRAERAQLINDAGALIERDKSPAALAKFDEMMAEADSLKAQISRLELAEQRTFEMLEAQRTAGTAGGFARASLGTDNLTYDGQDPELERETLYSYLRFGEGGLNAEQRDVFAKRFRASMGTTPDTAGGYTIPMGPMQTLVNAQKTYGGMLVAGCNVLDTNGGNQLPIPTSNDTNNTGIILGENTQVSEQDVAFGSVQLGAFTYSSKIVLVSNQLLQDSEFDIGDFLMQLLGTRIARIVNSHLTSGDGAAKPNGVITGSTLGYTAGGSTTSGATATIGSDDLIELEHSVDPAYRANARFMLSDTALKVVKKLKDSQGRPLWLPSIAESAPATILNYPYVINQDMAVPAAGAKSVAFGDFSKYYIRRVTGAQVVRLTERYADFNQTGFMCFQRWDGTLVDAGTHPVRYLQQANS